VVTIPGVTASKNKSGSPLLGTAAPRCLHHLPIPSKLAPDSAAGRCAQMDKYLVKPGTYTYSLRLRPVTPGTIGRPQDLPDARSLASSYAPPPPLAAARAALARAARARAATLPMMLIEHFILVSEDLTVLGVPVLWAALAACAGLAAAWYAAGN
jgi:hypothetical protein